MSISRRNGAQATESSRGLNVDSRRERQPIGRSSTIGGGFKRHSGYIVVAGNGTFAFAEERVKGFAWQATQ